jgi:hypothetical protein
VAVHAWRTGVARPTAVVQVITVNKVLTAWLADERCTRRARRGGRQRIGAARRQEHRSHWQRCSPSPKQRCAVAGGGSAASMEWGPSSRPGRDEKRGDRVSWRWWPAGR